MKCPNNDSYSVEGGNQKLKYPIALLSSDEIMLAGSNFYDILKSNNPNYYLYTSDWYWLLSPSSFSDSKAGYVFDVYYNGELSSPLISRKGGVRPALTISINTPLLSGTGSMEDPYVI